jgi:hypothetical protein
MSGKLTLSDHPAPLNGFGTPNGIGDLQAASKFYVDNQVFSSGVNLYVSASTGDDLQQRTPVGKEGRFWQYAYKTIGGAALAAENLIALANEEPGPYRQRITYTIGPDLTFTTTQDATISGGYKVQGAILTGGNAAVTGYQHAFELLQLNKEFIQAETIAYINNKYVNTFTYDRLEYQNNIKMLLDAVGYDIVLDSTYNTNTIATSILEATQTSELIQTIEAIKFARDQIVNFSYDSATLSAYMGVVIDAVCYDLIFQSNYQTIQAALAFNDANTDLNTEQITAVLNNFKNELIGIKATPTLSSGRVLTPASGVINANTITVGSNTGILIGMPVQGVGIAAGAVVSGIAGLVITLSANNVAAVSGSATFGANTIKVSSATGIAIGQSVIGAGVINGSLVSNIVGTTVFLNLDTGTVVSGVSTFRVDTPVSLQSIALTSVTVNINNMTTIINGGDVPAITTPSLVTTPIGISNARELLRNNIRFFQAETVAYLGAEYPNLAYNKENYRRDIEYITWSLIYDMVYGGNSQSLYIASRYWNGSTQTVSANEVPAIINLLTYINSLALVVIANDSPTTVYQQSVRQYRNETLSGGEAGGSSITANITSIKAIILDSTPSPAIPTVLPIVDNAATELKNVRNAILLLEDSYKTAAINYVENNFPVINDPVILASINSKFQLAIDLLTLDIEFRVIPTYANNATAGLTSARALLIENLDFIADETVAYMAAQTAGNAPPFVGLVYDSAQWNRELRYMIESVCYDFTYSSLDNDVNAASVFIGSKYWKNGVSQLPAGEILPKQDAIIFAANLSVLVSQNTAPGTTYSSTPQVTNPAFSGGSIAAAKISSLFTLIRNIIGDVATTPVIVYPSLNYAGNPYDTNFKTVRTIIANNKDEVALDTTAYLDEFFSGSFNYDESQYYRDLGLIVDGTSIDVITGGTWQSVAIGKSYYRDANSRSVTIGSQLTQTLDAINFAKLISNQVLNQTTANRYQTLVTQVFDGTKTAAAGAKTAVANNIDIITSIIVGGVAAGPMPTYGTGIWNVSISNGGVGYVDQGQGSQWLLDCVLSCAQ